MREYIIDDIINAVNIRGTATSTEMEDDLIYTKSDVSINQMTNSDVPMTPDAVMIKIKSQYSVGIYVLDVKCRTWKNENWRSQATYLVSELTNTYKPVCDHLHELVANELSRFGIEFSINLAMTLIANITWKDITEMKKMEDNISINEFINKTIYEKASQNYHGDKFNGHIETYCIRCKKPYDELSSILTVCDNCVEFIDFNINNDDNKSPYKGSIIQPVGPIKPSRDLSLISHEPVELEKDGENMVWDVINKIQESYREINTKIKALQLPITYDGKGSLISLIDVTADDVITRSRVEISLPMVNKFIRLKSGNLYSHQINLINLVLSHSEFSDDEIRKMILVSDSNDMTVYQFSKLSLFKLEGVLEPLDSDPIAMMVQIEQKILEMTEDRRFKKRLHWISKVFSVYIKNPYLGNSVTIKDLSNPERFDLINSLGSTNLSFKAAVGLRALDFTKLSHQTRLKGNAIRGAKIMDSKVRAALERLRPIIPGFYVLQNYYEMKLMYNIASDQSDEMPYINFCLRTNNIPKIDLIASRFIDYTTILVKSNQMSPGSLQTFMSDVTKDRYIIFGQSKRSDTISFFSFSSRTTYHLRKSCVENFKLLHPRIEPLLSNSNLTFDSFNDYQPEDDCNNLIKRVNLLAECNELLDKGMNFNTMNSKTMRSSPLSEINCILSEVDQLVISSKFFPMMMVNLFLLGIITNDKSYVACFLNVRYRMMCQLPLDKMFPASDNQKELVPKNGKTSLVQKLLGSMYILETLDQLSYMLSQENLMPIKVTRSINLLFSSERQTLSKVITYFQSMYGCLTKEMSNTNLMAGTASVLTEVDLDYYKPGNEVDKAVVKGNKLLFFSLCDQAKKYKYKSDVATNILFDTDRGDLKNSNSTASFITTIFIGRFIKYNVLDSYQITKLLEVYSRQVDDVSNTSFRRLFLSDLPYANSIKSLQLYIYDKIDNESTLDDYKVIDICAYESEKFKIGLLETIRKSNMARKGLTEYLILEKGLDMATAVEEISVNFDSTFTEFCKDHFDGMLPVNWSRGKLNTYYWHHRVRTVKNLNKVNMMTAEGNLTVAKLVKYIKCPINKSKPGEDSLTSEEAHIAKTILSYLSRNFEALLILAPMSFDLLFLTSYKAKYRMFYISAESIKNSEVVLLHGLDLLTPSSDKVWTDLAVNKYGRLRLLVFMKNEVKLREIMMNNCMIRLLNSAVDLSIKEILKTITSDKLFQPEKKKKIPELDDKRINNSAYSLVTSGSWDHPTGGSFTGFFYPISYAGFFVTDANKITRKFSDLPTRVNNINMCESRVQYIAVKKMKGGACRLLETHEEPKITDKITVLDTMSCAMAGLPVYSTTGILNQSYSDLIKHTLTFSYGDFSKLNCEHLILHDEPTTADIMFNNVYESMVVKTTNENVISFNETATHMVKIDRSLLDLVKFKMNQTPTRSAVSKFKLFSNSTVPWTRIQNFIYLCIELRILKTNKITEHVTSQITRCTMDMRKFQASASNIYLGVVANAYLSPEAREVIVRFLTTWGHKTLDVVYDVLKDNKWNNLVDPELNVKKEELDIWNNIRSSDIACPNGMEVKMPNIMAQGMIGSAASMFVALIQEMWEVKTLSADPILFHSGILSTEDFKLLFLNNKFMMVSNGTSDDQSSTISSLPSLSNYELLITTIVNRHRKFLNSFGLQVSTSKTYMTNLSPAFELNSRMFYSNDVGFNHMQQATALGSFTADTFHNLILNVLNKCLVYYTESGSMELTYSYFTSFLKSIRMMMNPLGKNLNFDNTYTHMFMVENWSKADLYISIFGGGDLICQKFKTMESLKAVLDSHYCLPENYHKFGPYSQADWSWYYNAKLVNDLSGKYSNYSKTNATILSAQSLKSYVNTVGKISYTKYKIDFRERLTLLADSLNIMTDTNNQSVTLMNRLLRHQKGITASTKTRFNETDLGVSLHLSSNLLAEGTVRIGQTVEAIIPVNSPLTLDVLEPSVTFMKKLSVNLTERYKWVELTTRNRDQTTRIMYDNLRFYFYLLYNEYRHIVTLTGTMADHSNNLVLIDNQSGRSLVMSESMAINNSKVNDSMYSRVLKSSELPKDPRSLTKLIVDMIDNGFPYPDKPVEFREFCSWLIEAVSNKIMEIASKSVPAVTVRLNTVIDKITPEELMSSLDGSSQGFIVNFEASQPKREIEKLGLDEIQLDLGIYGKPKIDLSQSAIFKDGTWFDYSSAALRLTKSGTKQMAMIIKDRNVIGVIVDMSTITVPEVASTVIRSVSANHYSVKQHKGLADCQSTIDEFNQELASLGIPKSVNCLAARVGKQSMNLYKADMSDPNLRALGVITMVPVIMVNMMTIKFLHCDLLMPLNFRTPSLRLLDVDLNIGQEIPLLATNRNQAGNKQTFEVFKLQLPPGMILIHESSNDSGFITTSKLSTNSTKSLGYPTIPFQLNQTPLDTKYSKFKVLPSTVIKPKLCNLNEMTDLEIIDIMESIGYKSPIKFKTKYQGSMCREISKDYENAIELIMSDYGYLGDFIDYNELRELVSADVGLNEY